MKSTLKDIGIIVVAVWMAGLSLYWGKKFPPTAGLAGKAKEGFGV